MAKINFLMDEVEVDAEKGERLLDVCQREGSSLPFGCTNGVCGTCVCKVRKGEENLSAMNDKPEKQTLEMFGAPLDGKTRLACQCFVNGDVELDNP